MLRLWLPLNGDLHNQGLDDATSTATGTVKWSNTGKIGKGFDINGGYVRYTVPSMVGTNIFSVSFWYKPISNESITANWNKILVFTTKKTDSTEGALFRFESSYNGGTSNTHAISVHNNVGEPIASVGHPLTGEWNKWHHIVAASDGTNMYTYCDNVLIRTSKCNGGTLAGSVYVGYSGPRPNGIMNDVRVYDHCLSELDIKHLSQGLIGHWTMSEAGMPNLLKISDLSNSKWGYWQGNSTWAAENIREKIIEDGKTWIHIHQYSNSGYGGYACDPLSNGITIDANKKYTWSCLARAGSDINAEIIMWVHWRSTEGGANLSQNSKKTQLTNTPTRISWTLPQFSHDTYTVNRINLMIGTSGTANNEIYFTDLKFEEGENATPYLPHTEEKDIGLDNGIQYDVSGYQNNASSTGVIVDDSVSPRYKTNKIFNGNASYYTLDRPLYDFYNNDFTIAVWLKPLDKTRGIILSEYSASGSSNVALELSSTPSIRLYWNGTPDWIGTGTALTIGKWSHIAVTKDSTHAYFYVDGILKDTKTATFSQRVSNACPRIGDDYRGGTSVSYNGGMSDLRLYSTCLSADDILAIYHTPASIASNGTLLTQGEISEV